MRIGIDCRLWNETGVGRYIRNLVKQLAFIDKVNDYVLFVKSSDVESIKYQVLSIKNAKDWKLVTVDIRWHSLQEQLQLPSILTKEQVDLMHFPYFSVPIFYTGKFVVTIHDLIINQVDTGKASTLPLPLYKVKRLGYKTVLKQTVKKAAKIIAVSGATKSDIVKYLGVDPGKVVVTYEGVDENISKLKTQNSKLQPKSKNFFLYVGNAYPHKNLERLLEALNILISKYPNISLVFVGKEDFFYRQVKTKVKEMGLSNNVIFYGQATDEDLVGLYQRAKALVVPSLIEGFGLPALEAMANGCLVLASDISSLREVCGGVPLYFNPYDMEDIKTKMELLCSNDLDQWRVRKEIGLKRAKMFSWEKMAEETLGVYKEVVI